MANYRLSMRKLIGKGYIRGWYTNCHCRYRLYAGARNTKKSYVIIGLEVLAKILSDHRRNVLILRDVAGSNKTSTFATIVSLISQPDPLYHPEISLSRYFHINNTTMLITYIPTGQTIRFEGMSNPEKIQGSKTVHGYLTDVYVEEAFEIKNYDDWRKVDGTIRGKLPEGLYHQITFCLNPWDIGSWIYDHFFEGRLVDDLDYMLTHDYQDWLDEDLVLDYGRGLYLHKSNYKINEFRDKDIYDTAMEELRRVAPEIWKVEAMGLWGNATDATYPEFIKDPNAIIRSPAVINNMDYSGYCIGIDTGLSNGEGKIKKDPNAKIGSATTMQLMGLSLDGRTLCHIDEYFYTNEREMVKKGSPELMEEIIRQIQDWMNTYRDKRILMQGLVPIYVDCADIGFRQGLVYIANQKGLNNLRFMKSTKIKIRTRVDYIRLIMAYGELLISKNCVNLIREYKSSHSGDKGEARADGNDHAINAGEYAWVSLYRKQIRYSTFKPR